MAYQSEVVAKVTAKTEGTESVKSLKTQIREATQEAAAMAQKFGEFSPEAITAAKRVAELKDQMDDLNEKIQALHPDKFNRINTIAQGVANGFQAAQGAMALFGAESEDAQKALLKVQGAMALAQGLEGLDAAGKQLKTLGQAAVGAFNSMTTASKVFLATGLGLIISGIAYAIANFDELAKSLGFAESEMSKMNKAMKIAAAETKIQADELNFYNDVVQDTSKSEGEREFALQKLKEAGIATDDVNIANANSLQALNNRVKDNIALIAQRARVEAAAQILQEKTKKLIEMQSGDLDEATGWWDKFVAGTKGYLGGMVFMNQQTIITEELIKRGSNNIKEAQKDVTDAVKVHQIELEKATKLEGENKSQQDKVTSTLKLRTEAQKNADKAAQVSAAKQAELQKRSAELLTQEELLGKTEVEKAKILAERKFKASTEGFKQGSKEYLAAQKIFNEEVAKIDSDAAEKQKAKDEKDAKDREEFQKTLQENILKANEAYYKSRELQILNSGKTQEQIQKDLDALQLEMLQANIESQQAINGENSAEVIAAELALAQKKKEIYDKDAANKKSAEEAKIDVQEKILQATYDSLAALQGILKEGSDAAKAAALLDIAIKTGVGFAQGLDIAQKGAAGTGPAAPYAFPVFYAQQVAAVLGAVSRAKAILKGGGSGGAGGGGGRVSVPSAPALAPTAGGTLPDEQQFGGMGRVYVLEGDITKTQTRVRRLRNTSVV